MSGRYVLDADPAGKRKARSRGDYLKRQMKSGANYLKNQISVWGEHLDSTHKAPTILSYAATLLAGLFTLIFGLVMFTKTEVCGNTLAQYGADAALQYGYWRNTGGGAEHAYENRHTYYELVVICVLGFLQIVSGLIGGGFAIWANVSTRFLILGNICLGFAFVPTLLEGWSGNFHVMYFWMNILLAIVFFIGAFYADYTNKASNKLNFAFLIGGASILAFYAGSVISQLAHFIVASATDVIYENHRVYFIVLLCLFIAWALCVLVYIIVVTVRPKESSSSWVARYLGHIVYILSGLIYMGVIAVYIYGRRCYGHPHAGRVSISAPMLP